MTSSYIGSRSSCDLRFLLKEKPWTSRSVWTASSKFSQIPSFFSFLAAILGLDVATCEWSLFRGSGSWGLQTAFCGWSTEPRNFEWKWSFSVSCLPWNKTLCFPCTTFAKKKIERDQMIYIHPRVTTTKKKNDLKHQFSTTFGGVCCSTWYSWGTYGPLVQTLSESCPPLETSACPVCLPLVFFLLETKPFCLLLHQATKNGTTRS